MSELVREGVDVELRVVGQPLAAPSDGRGDRVTFTGYVDTATLAQEYVDADAFVFPSLYEGFGIPMLEAMAAGLPVVSSDRGSLPEVGGTATVTVPALDVPSWTGALARLATDERERDRLRGAGFAHVARYSWSDSARSVRQALESAARR